MTQTALRRAAVIAIGIGGAVVLWSGAAAQTPTPALIKAYFPPKGSWTQRDPATLGMDKTKLDEAIAFAAKNENPNTKDLSVDIPNSFRTEAPYNNLIGPTQERAGINGIV